MEEVWGEVDHSINYPRPVDSIACKEQILALARSTSAATRLVDSIFATVADLTRHLDAQQGEKQARRAQPQKRKAQEARTSRKSTRATR